MPPEPRTTPLGKPRLSPPAAVIQEDPENQSSPRGRRLQLGGGIAVDYPEPKNCRVRAVMRGNTKRDTRPELAIRRAVYSHGLRYRVDHPIRLTGSLVRPDIVFPGARVAVFVDGCFWHGCPIHGTTPRSNAGYWTAKIARNRNRDTECTAALEAAGWCVLRIWEHEPKASAVTRIAAALNLRPTEGSAQILERANEHQGRVTGRRPAR